jgi:hypothetical protein
MYEMGVFNTPPQRKSDENKPAPHLSYSWRTYGAFQIVVCYNGPSDIARKFNGEVDCEHSCGKVNRKHDAGEPYYISDSVNSVKDIHTATWIPNNLTGIFNSFDNSTGRWSS